MHGLDGKVQINDGRRKRAAVVVVALHGEDAAALCLLRRLGVRLD